MKGWRAFSWIRTVKAVACVFEREELPSEDIGSLRSCQAELYSALRKNSGNGTRIKPTTKGSTSKLLVKSSGNPKQKSTDTKGMSCVKPKDDLNLSTTDRKLSVEPKQCVSGGGPAMSTERELLQSSSDEAASSEQVSSSSLYDEVASGDQKVNDSYRKTSVKPKQDHTAGGASYGARLGG